MGHTIDNIRKQTSKVKGAWEEFIDTGDVTHSSPRDLILDSWKSSRAKGISTQTPRARSALDIDEIEHCLHTDDLGRVGKHVLDRLSDSTFKTKHIVVLANAKGQILYSVGDRMVQSALEQINFMPGGSWSSDEVGPNGIGTPIVIDKPELILGSEHYCQAWQPWACYGSPIHDQSGEVIGAIDITGSMRDVSTQTMSLAISLACSVESGLNLLRLEKREILRQRYQQRKTQLHNNACCLIDKTGLILDSDYLLIKVLKPFDSHSYQSSIKDNQSLWSCIESRISQGIGAEFPYRLNSEREVTLIIEPVMESHDCLGVILIMDDAITHTVEADHRFKCQSDQLIKEALNKTNGNISKAARMLGINRTTIYRRLKLLSSSK